MIGADQARQCFLPHEVTVIVERGEDIGWLQVSETDEEIFLKQMFLQPAAQGAGSDQACWPT